MAVVSPVFGKIDKIQDGRIQIYISPEDNHHVYAPISGRITSITSENGLWYHHIETDEFIADVKKTGRVMINIDNKISFWLEVGSGYITDRIHIYVEQGDYVRQGQLSGEIILGSLSEIQLLTRRYQIKSGINQKVIGGKTIIANLRNFT